MSVAVPAIPDARTVMVEYPCPVALLGAMEFESMLKTVFLFL
jgi:hypothetical protein